MPKVCSYTGTRIELLYNEGLHPAEMFKLLKGEGLLVSFASVTRIIKKLQLTGSVAYLPPSGRPTELSEEANAFIDFIINPARHRPLTRPLSEPHTGTTRPKTLQLLRSLSYCTGNTQAYVYPGREQSKQRTPGPASLCVLSIFFVTNASLSLYMT